MAGSPSVSCPFCGFEAEGQHTEYKILLHIEEHHPEGGEQSPFIPREDTETPPSKERGGFAAFEGPGRGEFVPCEGLGEEEFVACEFPGCGEAIMLAELETHLMLHEFESESEDQVSKKLKLSHYEVSRKAELDMEDIGSSSRDRQAAKAQWDKIFASQKPHRHKSPYRRLGKSELGPFAHEDQMPAWLVKLLESDGRDKPMTRISRDGKLSQVMASENYAAGMIPIITQLLEQDPKTLYAYICQPEVLHISKLKREGGFCGYRNIQMLVSNMEALKIPGHHIFDQKIPTIFQIQDYIENAWDEGINATGREETGGIKGTRKYIGTPDAQAMLTYLGISCKAQALKSRPSKLAHNYLYETVEEYFSKGYTRSGNPTKIRQTQLPSIYLQHPGHSMTIIGIEKKTSGTMNLLVFDPMFHDNEKLTKHIGQNRIQFKAPADHLRAYRRGNPYLEKHKEFEILRFELPN